MIKNILFIIFIFIGLYGNAQAFDDVIYNIVHSVPFNYEATPHSLKFDAIKDSELISNVHTATYSFVDNFMELDSTSRVSLILSSKKIEYDNKGNVITFESFHKEQGNMTFKNEYAYDAKDRLISVKNDYDEVVETFVYKPQIVKQYFHENTFRFRNQDSIVYRLNSDGRVIQRNSYGAFVEAVEFRYNTNGDKVYENDTGDEVKIVYKYDAKNRIIYKELTGDDIAYRLTKMVSKFIYDSKDHLVKQTDYDGFYETEYYYTNNLLIKEVYTKYSVEELVIDYDYDEHGNWIRKIIKFGEGDDRVDQISLREINYR